VQLFDTWAGELARAEYDAFELPAIQLLIDELDPGPTPVILYTKAAGHLLSSLEKTGANVLSVDWRIDLAEARRSLKFKVGLQGNIDPIVLLSGEEAARQAARSAIEKTQGLGHILNLGHGILPTTPVENARAFVEAGQSVTIPARATIGQP
jgi:uroporphyrinogen decarboxylase